MVFKQLVCEEVLLVEVFCDILCVELLYGSVLPWALLNARAPCRLMQHTLLHSASHSHCGVVRGWPVLKQRPCTP
eukprot:342565-Amphidinium_carterae.1